MSKQQSHLRKLLRRTSALAGAAWLFMAPDRLLNAPVISIRARRARQRASTRGMALLAAGAALFIGLGINLARPVQTAAATNNVINFQARLESSSGAIAADGNYNVEFKIYEGGTTGGGGTLKWTEDWLVSSGHQIQVVNGYLTANLGSITSLATAGIDWDQQLFLTMNIGQTPGTSCSPFSTCSPDGEMSPRLQVTAVPYAFRAGTLADPANTGSTLTWASQGGANNLQLPDGGGTLCSTANTGASCSGAFIQNQNSIDQTANFDINGSGKAVSGFIGPSLTYTGALSITSGSGTNLSLTAGTSGTASLDTGSSGGTVSVASTAGTLNLANGSGAATINVANTTTAGLTLNIAGGANSSTDNINIANGATAATTAVNILSGSGTAGTASLSLGNNARVNQIDIGNVAAAAARTINIGTGNNTVGIDTLNIGTGNTTVAGGKAINIGSGTPSGSGTNIVTIGSNANTASITTIQGGNSASSTTAIALTPQTTGTIVIGAAAGTGNITLGSSSQAQTVIVGGGAGVSTVQIAGGSAANVVSIGNVQNAGSISLGAGLTTGTINLGGTSMTSGTTTIQGGNGTASGGIGLVLKTTAGAAGTTAGAGGGITLTAGNGGNGSTTNGNGGNLKLTAGAAGTGAGTAGTAGSVVVQNAGDSTAAFQVQNAGGTGTLLNIDTLNSNASILGNDNGDIQTWQSTQPLNTGTIAKSVVLNGYIYQISDGQGVLTNEYAKLNADGSTSAWTNLSSNIPDSHGLNAPSVVAAGGYIYLIGGRENSSPNTITTTIYAAKQNADGTLSAWTTLASILPTGVWEAGATAANGYIYVVGGTTTNTPTPSSNVYYAKYNADGTLNAWTTQTGVLPTAVAGNGVAAANGYIYSVGGYNSSNPQKYTYYGRLDPGTGATGGTSGAGGSWTAATGTGLLPTATDNPRVVTQNGYIYAISGDTGTSFWSGLNSVNTVFYTKLNTDGSINSAGWQTSAKTLNTNTLTPGVAAANGYIYLVGGGIFGSSFTTVYYTSGARLQVGASLDLVGAQGGNLSDPGAGGSLTAGDTQIIGALQVQDQASFNSSVVVGGNLGVGGNLVVNTASGYSGDIIGVESNGTVEFDADTSGNIRQGNGSYVYNTGANSPSNYSTSSSANLTTSDLLKERLILTSFSGSAQLFMPTASTITAAIPHVAVGDMFRFTIINNNAANGDTLVAGANISLPFSSNVYVVGRLTTQDFICQVTATGTPAITCW